ncbi:hypothetical protein RhiirA1_479438 [Rhizophagus irregularis]|uniref:Uncharacterized protein n=1 Tax=Rhizophagus irregularis TaxID=588596 RepID=A0A2I1FL47_9GLOM|nr:hypothetical protein RhiirA1_479438 [Rhizophagus irregularis]PKY35107.1 hypothetical protein RhiirB3_455486 [Rhizophagus irregularis]
MSYICCASDRQIATRNGSSRLISFFEHFGLDSLPHFGLDSLSVIGGVYGVAETFPELEVIPSNKISIREAACLQNAGLVSGGICNCKGECNSNKCRCKKAGGDCSSRCYSGRSWQK